MVIGILSVAVTASVAIMFICKFAHGLGLMFMMTDLTRDMLLIIRWTMLVRRLVRLAGVLTLVDCSLNVVSYCEADALTVNTCLSIMVLLD